MAARSPPLNTDPWVHALIVGPRAADNAILRKVLDHQRIGAEEVGVHDLTPELPRVHSSVVICSQEGFTYDMRHVLLRIAEAQPRWARLPLVLLLDSQFDGATVAAELQDLMLRCDVTIIPRPVDRVVFTSSVLSAVSSRRRQLEIRDHIAYQVELQRELNHRVKNALSTFMAIYRISRQQSSDLEDFSTRFMERFRALTAVHDMLDEAGTSGETLRNIMAGVVGPYKDLETENLILAGPSITFDRGQAFTLALMINELATNSAKYGALSVPGGVVTVQWHLDQQNNKQLRLEWTEKGGPPVKPPSRVGYGTRFVKISASSLGGQCEFDYAPSGFSFRLTMRYPA